MFTTAEIRNTLARLNGSLVFTPSLSDSEKPWVHPTPGPYATPPEAAVMVRKGSATIHACNLVWGGHGWTRREDDKRAARLLQIVMLDRMETA